MHFNRKNTALVSTILLLSVLFVQLVVPLHFFDSSHHLLSHKNCNNNPNSSSYDDCFICNFHFFAPLLTAHEVTIYKKDIIVFFSIKYNIEFIEKIHFKSLKLRGPPLLLNIFNDYRIFY